MNSTLVGGLTRSARESWLAIVAIVIGAGCGGGTSSNGDNCTAVVVACGGDITGTWKVVSSCFSGAASTSDLDCTGESIYVDSISLEATITFSAGTYDESLTSSSAVSTVTAPVSCLGGAGCPTSVTTDAGESATCSVSGSNCVCTETITGGQSTASGTYTTSGSMITVTPSGGSAATDGYCVQGSTLTLSQSAASTITSGPAGQLTLVRQ
jgi:hypothetical protein